MCCAPQRAPRWSKRKTGKIGIIGTAATIASGSYRKEIERLAPKTEVFEQACPLFVPLVENAFVSPDDPYPAPDGRALLNAHP